MTHPDFQSIVQWVSAPIGAGTNTAFGVGTTTLMAPTTLGSYQNLMFRVTGMTSDALFTVFSYDSTTGLLATGQRQIWLRSGQPATFVVPILGGAFAVNIQGAFAGSNITWAAYGTNLPTGLWPNDPTQHLRRAWPAGPVAPAASAGFQIAPYAGNVLLTAATQAQPFGITVFGVDFTGAETFDYALLSIAAATRLIWPMYLGPTLNVINVQNTGGVADSIFIAITAAPQSRELY